jgi:hypothetical protein
MYDSDFSNILKLINGGGCPRGSHGREITWFVIRLTSKLTSSEEDAPKELISC